MAIQGGKGEMRIVLKVKDDGSAVIEKFGDKAEQTGKKSSKAFDDFASGAGISFKGVATYAGMAAAAVVAVGVASVKAQIDVADSSAKSARAVGMNVEAYSALSYQASLTMKDVGALDIALRTMTRNLGEAANGAGPAKDALRDLGLNAKTLAAMSPDRALEEIADALDQVKNSNDKATIANKLFGESGSQMLLLMNGGKEAMRAAREEAQRYGKVIGTDTAKAAEDFNKNITRLQANLDGMVMKIAAKYLPGLVSLTEAMLGTDEYDDLLKERTKLDDRIQMMEQEGLYVDNLKKRLAEVDQQILDRAKKYQDMQKQLATTTPAATGGGPRRGGGSEEGKGDDSAQKAAEALRAQEAERIAALSESLMSENELLANDYFEKQILLQDALNNKVITEGNFYSLHEALEAQHQKKVADITARARQQEMIADKISLTSKLAMTAQIFGNLSSLMSSHSKRQFQLGKVAAIAEGLISTYLGAQHAFTQASKVGGLPLGIAAAAAATIAGLVRVNAIRGQQFGGSGSAAPGGGAMPTYDANPYTGQPADSYGVAPPQDNTPVQRVERLTLVADGPLSDAWVRDRLIPKINQASRDGVRLEVAMA